MSTEERTPTSDPEKPATISLKDRMALIFSFTALVLAMVNFWWSTSRIDDHLQGGPNYVSLVYPPAHGAGDSLDIRLLYSNLGNRQAMVRHPQVRFDWPDGSCDTIHYWQYRESSQIPFILPVSEMALVMIRVPLDTCVHWLSKRVLRQASDTALINMRVGFRGTDPCGSVHEANWEEGIPFTLRFVRQSSGSGEDSLDSALHPEKIWQFNRITNLYDQRPLQVIYDN